MTLYGFHASHEQIPPSRLLTAAQRAESAGFGAGMCSDHFAPWSGEQGESGFAWSWLGAALQATGLTFGVVNAPGQRYHPAVIAQAAATLAEMYPGRLWVALGSGEAMNEHITGDRWPPKPERRARLRECVDVIRALLAGEEVTHRGLVTVDRAKLWTLPETQPLLIGAAASPESAALVGEWADGMVTVNMPADVLKQVIAEFRDNGGEGKPVYLQLHLSYAATEQAALATAYEQWRPSVLGDPLAWDLDSPAAFDAATRFVKPDDVRETVLVSADPAELAGRIQEHADLGFDAVYLHHVGVEQDEFIDVFGADVLPRLGGGST
jgi:probable non-F420 flavinoid oxidoreductase